MTEAPPLPPGRVVDLPGRGPLFVRELGEPGAPALLLLHGWTATADLNWFAAYQPLADAGFRVVAPDHRGHGRSMRTPRPFRLVDAADDAAALAAELGIERAIVAGYSMGGPVGLLVWRRHPALVQGLVLCATTLRFVHSSQTRGRLRALGFFGLGSRLLPGGTRRAMGERIMSGMNARRNLAPWVQRELLLADPRALLDAGGEIGRWDATGWAPAVDVPTSVLVTTRDDLVPPDTQRAMAAAIAGSTMHEAHGTHIVCVEKPSAFVPPLLDAVASVASRV
jgi:3-oxoadipate enol-lactonase